jgi:rRNA maturation RNase YbeY
MAPRISVRNLQRKTRVDSRQLQQFAALVLERCLALKSPDHSTLDSFLNHAGPTDVITFQHGEVFISTETARRHAKQFGTTMLHELQLYIIHGLLHLHGFDDQTAAGAKRMITTQERLLAQIAG